MTREAREELCARAHDLARALRTQDNRATADPVYLVQRKVTDFGYALQWIERAAWFWPDGEVMPREDWDKVEKAYQHNRETVTLDMGGGEKETFRLDELERTGYVERWETVQTFLTKAAAEKYIAANGHFHGEMRVWVDSAHRNPEMQFIRELFLALLDPDVVL